MAETEAQTLERFFQTLIDAVRETRAGNPDEPLTVAEIYQDLVPYRIARSTVGFAMNADYEHALMRLLAGEGDFVRMDPAEAQRELRRELDTTNPDVTLYRKFAACDVWLRTEPMSTDGNGAASPEPPSTEAADPVEPPATRRAAAPGEPLPFPQATDPPRSSAPAQSRTNTAPAPAQSQTNPAPAPPGAPSQADAAPHVRTASCASCGETLPAGRRVRFCPFCGEDQRAPCRECGELLDPEWRFCIVCGRRATSGA